MGAVGRAFAWDYWGRYRYVLYAGLAYLAVLAAVMYAVPAETFKTERLDT